MLRVRTSISGLQGAPYLSTHYFTGGDLAAAQAAATAVRNFWVAVAPVIITGTAMQVDTTVAFMAESTGQITGLFPVTAAVVNGSGSGEALPFATQGLVRWRTGHFEGGREVRGRTFIPRPTEADSLGGVPAAAYQTTVLAAANGLRTAIAGGLTIWHRPSAPGAGDGSAFEVTSDSVWNQWAVLRSRRD